MGRTVRGGRPGLRRGSADERPDQQRITVAVVRVARLVLALRAGIIPLGHISPVVAAIAEGQLPKVTPRAAVQARAAGSSLGRRFTGGRRFKAAGGSRGARAGSRRRRRGGQSRTGCSPPMGDRLNGGVDRPVGY